MGGYTHALRKSLPRNVGIARREGGGAQSAHPLERKPSRFTPFHGTPVSESAKRLRSRAAAQTRRGGEAGGRLVSG